MFKWYLRRFLSQRKYRVWLHQAIWDAIENDDFRGKVLEYSNEVYDGLSGDADVSTNTNWFVNLMCLSFKELNK